MAQPSIWWLTLRSISSNINSYRPHGSHDYGLRALYKYLTASNRSCYSLYINYMNSPAYTSGTLTDLQAAVAHHRDMILANLVMIAEIPAPTCGEKRRARFFAERLSQQQLHNCSTDDVGNAFGILLGGNVERNILVAAHFDTNFSEEIDHTVHVDSEHIRGVGVGDNSLGVATVATLPILLERLGITLRSNLILMGTAKSLGAGDIAGIRAFLENTSIPINSAVFVEGFKLGRLSVESPGMMRSEILYEIEDRFDWRRGDVPNAIVALNEIVNRILELPVPSRPQTTVSLNAFRAGRSFNWIPAAGKLRFEIRSDNDTLVDELATQITTICDEVCSRSGAKISLQVIARRSPGGLPFSHPLVVAGKQVLTGLGCDVTFLPSTSELSACIDRGIPAITIGISDSSNINMPNEELELAPISTGVAQLIALLQIIDSGICDVTE